MAGVVTSGGLQSTSLHAETGAEAWLRYAPLDSRSAGKYQRLPVTIVALGDSIVLRTAQQELSLGVKGMLGRSLEIAPGLPAGKAIVLGTVNQLSASGEALLPPAIRDDGYWLTHRRVHGFECLVVTANSERGVLYGVFGLLSKIARHQDLMAVDEVQEPYAPLRWINQWDNLDGRIERGYAGPSIFFEGGKVRDDLTRAGQYARLLASVGINGCTINNVNADPRVLEDGFTSQVARVADVFRPWGVRLSLSVDLSTPKASGELDTFDPLEPRVAEWWRHKVETIYQRIPDFGGFVVKADSEGRLGPATYRRTPADAANVIARALKSHEGKLFYRAFVYDHHLDWHNLKNDRAKAAYDNFHALDGKFEDNVVIQIKHGPIDFQVREPVSPLLGGLERTNEAIELQITQEYTGQQRHLCFLVPMWKEVLDFDLHVAQESTPVRDLVAGRIFHRPTGGLVGVANVGMNTNWLGSPLALSNLYGFGRLAWDPGLSSQTIVDEWTRLTFGNDSLVVGTIAEMQLASWRVYESYTGPLGAGTLTDILGSHYGPGPESSEENGWGQWHRADHVGIGMDRTVATGTGFIGEYSPAVQRQYESLANCPDELLLFFHHVPYTHVLHSGKTVIQHIYDSHYEGADRAQGYVSQWKLLKGYIDDGRYAEVLARLQYQAGHAIVWRDAINDWFHRMTGISDQRGRVEYHPERIEAEDMRLQGYVPFGLTPWEGASGGKAVECPKSTERCTAALRFTGAAGEYEVDVQYFDQNNGTSRFRVYLGDRVVDQWLADDHLPSAKPNADSSTRRVLQMALKPGDEIRIEGAPDNGERAPLDYVEIRAQRPH
jgi:alpha-glucuronidase